MSRLLAAGSVVAVAAFPAAGVTDATFPPGFRCSPGRVVRRPAPADPVQAYFTRRSYSPGERATLVVRRPTGALRLAIVHAGVGRKRRGAVQGVPVTTPEEVHGRRLSLTIGTWPSGLYFARLEAGHGRVGYAPFVLREPVATASRTAIVLPTYTWQAYNFFDGDGNGIGDTWYADPRVGTVGLARPFVDRGVPPQLGGFVRWAAHTGRVGDYLSDDDLEALARGDALSRMFRLIVFSGHEEYATREVFDALRRFRDRGGRLIFLSSNNLYKRVVVRRARMSCVGLFRADGRPEAALVGVGYLDWSRGVHRNRPFVVAGARRARWFFRGTGLRNGDSFGFAYGSEIDARTAASPRQTIVVARIPNIFGPGRTAEMTYYATRRGAEVFAAGAKNFSAPQSPVAAKLLDNLWTRFSRP